ncbi:hypothetical protein [Staphylococcus aureus]
MNTNHQKLLNNFEILKLKKFKIIIQTILNYFLKMRNLTEILIDLTEKK